MNTFSEILKMSITSSITIFVVLLARLALKKMPKLFSYLLWAIVLFKLLCPMTIPSPLSLFNVFGQWESQKSMEVVNLPNEYLDAQLYIDSPQPQTSDLEAKAINIGEHSPILGSSEKGNIFAYIWLIGIIALCTYSIIQFVRLKRQLIGSSAFSENICLADHIDSPFVMGIFRPKIYLPSWIDGNEREYIILHEKQHIHRGDHIFKLLAFCALCLHWFNAMVWLSFVLASKDMEMSCDEAVIKKSSNDIRAEYSASILKFATKRRSFSITPVAFGEGDTKSRIKNVLNYKKPSLLIIIIAVILCLSLAICLVTSPENKNDETIHNPFGNRYSISEVVYQDIRYDTAYVVYPDFILTDEHVFMIKENNNFDHIIDGWHSFGPIEEFKLEEENFDKYFYEFKEEASKLREDNQTSWQWLINDKDGYSYYVLQQKNGDVYIALLYGDEDHFTDPESDDSNIRYLFKVIPWDDTSLTIKDEYGNILHDFRESTIYVCYDSIEPVVKPSIMLSARDNSFQFVYSMFSSYLAIGEYELTDEKLTLRDGDRVFIFDVVGDTFVFDAENSYPIPKYRYSADSYEYISPVPDGAVFFNTLSEIISDSESTDTPTDKENLNTDIR